MRNLLIAAIGAVTLSALVACSDTPTHPGGDFTRIASEAVNFKPSTDACGVPKSVLLLAGQHHEAGSVTAANDDDYLYVTFSLDGWTMSESHLYVGTSPPNNSAPGQFPYSAEHDPAVDSYTYQIPLGDWDGGEKLYIAAHAVVWEDGADKSETAWGEGDRIHQRGNWSMYFSYDIQECNGDDDPVIPEGCETAFAFGQTELNSLVQGERWGWQITFDGTAYSETLWAGAGQNEGGTPAGTFSLAHSSGTLTATYNTANSGWGLMETHLYVGEEQIATGAPGKFGNTHEDLNGALTDVFTFDNIQSFPLYVVAHAVVCELEAE
jgi:hypothetical protein